MRDGGKKSTGTRVGREWKVSGLARAAGERNSDFIRELQISAIEPGFDTPRAPLGAADLWAAAAAADPSWDGMSGERESRGRLCEHIARL